MKKRIITGIIIAVLAILLIPIPRALKDGGTVEYNAVLYSVHKVHSLTDNGFKEGTRVRILFFTVYDDVSPTGGIMTLSAGPKYDICYVCGDPVFKDILDGRTVPVKVICGFGGEQGYLTYSSEDPEVINGFIEAFRQIKINRVEIDNVDVDRINDYTFEMEDGSSVFISLDGRTADKGLFVFQLENTDKLNEMKVLIQGTERE